METLATPNPVRAEQPEGKWRLVPVEPTDEMCDVIEYGAASRMSETFRAERMDFLRKAIASAPAAPGAGVGVDGVYALPGERVSMTWAQYVELKALSRQVDARLFDSQWVNIVNAPEVLRAESAEEAVNIAVKMTEQQMAKNLADGNWPKPFRKSYPTAHKAQEESNG